MFVVFFFQAEDGIRDVAVTGVQTCALPIYLLALLEAADRMVLVVMLLQALKTPSLVVMTETKAA